MEKNTKKHDKRQIKEAIRKKKMADYAKAIDEKSSELLQAYNDADIVLTVGSISTTKQTSIIYNSSNGKYYLWRYDNKCSI